MGNPHDYWRRSILTHPETTPGWIERALVHPYTVKVDDGNPGRRVYHAYIPEAGRRGRWLLVITQDDQLFNAYFNRALLREYGRPE